jgi:hypothetical protein
MEAEESPVSMLRVRSLARARLLGLVVLLALVATLVPPTPAAAAGTTPVMGTPVLSENELVAWFDSRWRPEFRAGNGSVTPRQLIRIYLEEGRAEGVAGDIAFVQAILETGWFHFPDGGQVKPSDNNFAGMGAYDGSGGVSVFKFPDVRTGVRAQLHHLRIYADPGVNTTGSNLGSGSIARDIEDRYPPRWRLIRNSTTNGVHNYWARAQNWEDFGNGMWATDPNYASKILNLYGAALTYNGYPADAASRMEWHYRYTNTGGSANLRGFFGRAGDVVLACDWNGNGRETPAVFRDGDWIVTNNLGGSGPYTTFRFGRAGDLPLCGDWNGNGRDTVGIVRDREWHLRNSLSGGAAELSFVYGQVTRGDIPVVGDWNGNGRDTVGIIRDREWHLRNSLSGGKGQIVFTYGRMTRGDRPLVGDWNGDGRDGVGIVRDREWHLRNSLSGGKAQVSFTYGRVTAGDVPLTGDWNADGRASPAIVR